MASFALCLGAIPANADISSHYTGKKISSFLEANPGAVTKRGSIYIWRGGVEGTGVPTINPGPGGGLRDFQLECRLEIATANGVIKSIKIAHDTIGNWNLSRCAEVVN
jgi:hypothetical protein